MMTGQEMLQFNQAPAPYNTSHQQYNTVKQPYNNMQLQYNLEQSQYNNTQYNLPPQYNMSRGDCVGYRGEG
jgi:glycine betaine/choline ABC-type transport system substrate-binding protein